MIDLLVKFILAWIRTYLTKIEYLFVPLHARYAGAEWGCIAYGGRLAVITSEEEDRFLQSMAPAEQYVSFT